MGATVNHLSVGLRSGVKRRGSSGGVDRKQRAVGDHLDDDCATGVSELRRTRSSEGLGVRAELTRRTRRAVLRVLEVTEEIVVLECRRDEDEGIECHPDRGQEPATICPEAEQHLI